MNLLELLQHHARAPQTSVPNWMIGCFRRRCISFVDGTSDQQTVVYWLQSRNLTIDLRLPIATEQVSAGDRDSTTAREIMADYEGWIATSTWDGEQLQWHQPTSLQVHNRWPEPALLSRVGNCMIEFAPSGAYVEDWRLQPSPPGPLTGLQLIEERREDGTLIRTGGGLIVCGQYAALVLDRPLESKASPVMDSTPDLSTLIRNGAGADKLLDFETSVAIGSSSTGFHIRHSTRPERIGQELCALDGFAVPTADGLLHQRLVIDGYPVERLWTIDTLEPGFDFSQTTDTTDAADEWLNCEAHTLRRYTEALF